jgi:hypothetical protein
MYVYPHYSVSRLGYCKLSSLHWSIVENYEVGRGYISACVLFLTYCIPLDWPPFTHSLFFSLM